MKSFHQPVFFLVFKFTVFVLMSGFIVNQLFFQNDINNQWMIFRSSFTGENMALFILAVLLMPVNWMLETVKWKWLISSSATFPNLLKSVIAGVTLGFVTPARSGEFIGRVMFLNDEDKTKIFYLSILGGIAHTAVTLWGGAICIALWSSNSFVSGLISGVAAFFLLLYFRFDWFNRFISSIRFLERRSLVVHNHHLPVFSVQLKVLAITFIRYAVYIVQYALLLMFFGISSDFMSLLLHNGVFFVIHSFSPLMPFLDFSFRGGTALYVFHDLSHNNIAVLAAVTWAWFLNLVVPSVMGYLFILNRRTLAHVIQ